MTSRDMEPNEQILREGSSHHTDMIPQPHHSHHHHHHHHHHHKSHHHHYHNNVHQHHKIHNHHNKHNKHTEGLKTVDVDEFFEHSLPDMGDIEKTDPNNSDDETALTKLAIPIARPMHSGSSSGLSKSLPLNIHADLSCKNEVHLLEDRMEAWKVIEEEEKYQLTHSNIEDKDNLKGVRTQRRTVSMNEDIIQNNFRKPLEELHQIKPFQENSMATINHLPKLIIPKAMPPRTRRLSKSTCKSPESPFRTKEDEYVKMIDKYISCCNSNYEEVEKQINTTFSTLSLALNHRRKTLIEEAKEIRDGKVKSLIEKKEKLTNEILSDLECVTPVNEMQSHEVEENIGIHEPWNNSATLSTHMDHPSSEQADSSATNSSGNDQKAQNRIIELYLKTRATRVGPPENHEVNGVSNTHFGETNSSSSGYATSSPTELSGSTFNCFDPSHQNISSLGNIEEGNVTFTYNNDSDMDFISKIGKLNQDLSSPRSSLIKGLTYSNGIVGDKVEFEVHTNDRRGEPNFNIADIITIRIYDRNRNKVQVEEESSPSRQRDSSFNDSWKQNATSNVYRYSFVPLKHGKHEIAVKLNDIHIANSPNTYLAYPHLDLTFTSQKQTVDEGEDHHFALNSSRSRISQESNSDETGQEEEEEEEDECHPHSMNVSDSWIVQKDGKSSLLQSLCNHPSDIYANEPVSGMCGWQVRITTACMHIKLNIGVKTRSGIPDLDEQFACDFHLESFAETASSLDRANHVQHHAHHRIQRKSSIFTRLSWTFTLLINDGVLRVTCHELDQDKRVEINLRGAFPLRPYCSMIHHHNDDDVPHICPRPQLTFL